MLDRATHARALTRLRTDQLLASRLCLRIIDRQTGRLCSLVANQAQQVLEAERQRQLEAQGYVRIIVCKGRQLGISTWIAGVCYLGTKLALGRRAKILADTLDRAGSLFETHERFETHAPELIARPQLVAQRRKQLAWAGDSSLLVGTAGDPEAGRSETLWYVHCSEFAFWPHADAILAGLLQAVPPGRGEVYIESTPNGMGDTFHRMWEAATGGESGWAPVFLPWWTAPEYRSELTEGERAEIEASADPWERRALDEGVAWGGQTYRLDAGQLMFRRRKIADDFDSDELRWRREYPSTADEGFVAAGGAYFDGDALGRLTAQTRTTKAHRRSFAAGRLVKAERGPLRIWEWPRAEAHYVIGADTAQGLQVRAQRDDGELGRDYSSADVLRVAEWVSHDAEGRPLEQPVLVASRAQVASLHGYMAPEVFAEGLMLLGALYACATDMGMRDSREPALIGVERNHSSGQTVLRWLLDHDYPRLYRQRRAAVVGERRPSVVYGWTTDLSSRRMILDALAEAVRTETSGICSPETVSEMRSFVLNALGRPEAQEGAHDDRVISYAIALEMSRWHSHHGRAPAVERAWKMTPTGV